MAEHRHSERQSVTRETCLEHQGWHAAHGREHRERHPTFRNVSNLQGRLVHWGKDEGVELVVLEHPLEEPSYLLVGLAVLTWSEDERGLRLTDEMGTY